MTKTRGLLLAIAAAATLALASPAAAATPHDPILFVHGWNSSSSTWTTMVSNFSADGWTAPELNNWSYNTSQSNATTAAQVRDKVDSILAATGNTKVDIVTHSMGGLSSRYYIKNLAGDAKVDDWVSLAGPNHGTNSANFCTQTSCVEMRRGSTFLANLNAGDETPGAVNYGTWRSNCDGVISPVDSTVLAGATNTLTGCIAHTSMPSNRTVYTQVRDFVR